jgi:hypothetical protein
VSQKFEDLGLCLSVNSIHGGLLRPGVLLSSIFKKFLSLFGLYYHDPDRVVVIKTEKSWGTREK